MSLAFAVAGWDDYGSPAERIPRYSQRGYFTGDWKEEELKTRAYTGWRGASAEIQFGATGAIGVGPFMPGGGRADVYLDGKLDRTVEGHPDEDSWNTSDAVCHAFKLKPGTHKIRLVVLGEPNAGWPGSAISLEGLVVLR